MKFTNIFDTESAMTEYLSSADLDTYVFYVIETDRIVYSEKKEKPYAEQYLTFESLDDNNTIYFNASVDNYVKTISASTDGTSWIAYTASTGGTPIAVLNAGDKVLIKGENAAYGNGVTNYTSFGSSGRFDAYGNIMSLINGDDFVGTTTLEDRYNFPALFQNSGIVSAENLILPTTTLTHGCYRIMFQGCSNLTTAPVLSATTLVNYCYLNMFNSCYNLNYIKCLANDISAQYCTTNWVSGVAESGTFVKTASMSSWTSGESGIPSNWTVQNDDGSPVPLDNDPISGDDAD